MLNEEHRLSDFLADDKFIEWRLSRTPELDDFWARFIEEHPECADELEQAVRKFENIQINKFEIDRQKSEILFKSIISSVGVSRRRRKLIAYASAAACLLVMLTAGILFQSRLASGAYETNTIVAQPLPAEDIQFISGDRILTVENDADFIIGDDGILSITEKGGRTIQEKQLEEIIMQKLIVPRGKRSRLTLPDGSKVWLNAGTELEFPSRFSSGPRNISVVGEIYVEVAADKERPFLVHTSDLDVKVHGTSFNLSSYDTQTERSVVLVNGSVEVFHQGDACMLVPGEMFAVNDGSVMHNCVETEYYTSWINGVLKLNRTPVSEILEKVSRYYNIDFQDNQSSLMARTCSGTLVLADDVEDVIRSLCLISGGGFERLGDIVYITDRI